MHGYAATSLRDIAEEADTKAGSLYYHFASKDALVEEVLRQAIVEIHSHVSQVVEGLGEGATYAERIRAAIAAHTESVMERTDYAKALMRITGQLPADVLARHNRFARAYGDYWARLFQQARDAGEIRADLDLTIARLLVIGAMNWTIEWPGRRWSPDSISKTLSGMVFDGVGPG